LHTLPEREFAAGMAEVIKYGLIYDIDLLTLLESEIDSINSLNVDVLKKVIYRCCEIKSEIVSQDEKEAGLRALLNLGHTFGHAIEAEMGYGNWLHGEAVAAGMMLALQLANRRGDISELELERVKTLITNYKLPTTPPDSMTSQQFLGHMRKDKKNQQGKIRFIVPKQLGQCALVDDVSDSEVSELIGH